MAESYQRIYQDSIADPVTFWKQQATRIHWQQPFSDDEVCDPSNPPFVRWFQGGTTNLCFNALDRHLSDRGHQPALIWESTEVNQAVTYSYTDLYRKVNSTAAVLTSLGVEPGDRVIIYMPMIPEAVFTMLACARLGAIHSVVFGGFAPASLAKRLDDARARLLVTADAGMRGGKVIPYKHLVDEAISLSNAPPGRVLLVNRRLADDLPWQESRDVDFTDLMEQFANVDIPVRWLESNHPSYILYTSGTTGTPKGIQRDTGGHAVALASSMDMVYGLRAGETMLTTSDIGWVVGHSYIVYGPLLAGATTILYEGLPTNPDPGIWWRLVEKYRVSVMFSSPTAIRVLKKTDVSYIEDADTSSLRSLFLAGEPLDESTHEWIEGVLRTRVIDHYWQTETGWPILANCAGSAEIPVKYGSPTWAVYGYALEIVDEHLQPVPRGTKGRLVARFPLPPGCMTTIWENDQRFRQQYFVQRGGDWLYLTGDYAIQDEDGYYFMLGRDDDVINVAGHRLGTREIEEALCTSRLVAEAAVVGVKEELKGQAVIAFVVAREAGSEPENSSALKKLVDRELGAIARPAAIHFVPALPKTRSGKVMRRALLALAEGTDPGDLSTMEDPTTLEAIRRQLLEDRP